MRYGSYFPVRSGIVEYATVLKELGYFTQIGEFVRSSMNLLYLVRLQGRLQLIEGAVTNGYDFPSGLLSGMIGGYDIFLGWYNFG